ncbi:hypothetical protein [Saccharothrix sp. ALI-22-I]|uniref:hypothetical protein n=1 Tax=Saccharothrix sp. ALI-22-I TaxID=1933778 RepID=UPI00117B156A|nr:hypothetical protein [Saccharothrix sp. ALI-22-I]
MTLHDSEEDPLRRWQVQVHIQGEVTAVDPVESNQVDLASPLPTPPVRWGTATALLPPSVMFPSLLGGDVFRPAATRTGVLYRNDGSTTLTVTLEALRPRNVHDTDPDEFALVVHAPDITELRGTWRITARGHHRVYKGELTIPVEQLNDVGEAIRAVLIPEEDTDDAPDIEEDED